MEQSTKNNLIHEPMPSKSEFSKICDLIREYAGIELSENKYQMVVNRLRDTLRKTDHASWDRYIKEVIENDKGQRQSFINSLTTNKTEFYREKKQFEKLRSLVFSKYRNLEQVPTIWVAAASYGQEAYTIAMENHDYYFSYGLTKPIRILATDIDDQVLKKAESGVYENGEVHPYFTVEQLRSYFEQGKGSNSGYMRVKEHLRNGVKFRQQNLLAIDIDPQIKFDAIFIRNVLIYFSEKNIKRIIETMTGYLKEEGYLFLGSSESINFEAFRLKALGTSIYQKI